MTSADARITVLLADDNLLVREGVRALLRMAGDFDVVATAEDYDGLVAGAVEHRPQVVVTDIRMPPRFANEGIEAAKEVRKRLPGTGVVVLSQYDDPEYAVALLAQGAAGYAYLLKERVADGDRLARAVREVAAGGSMLDPEIVQALVTPARGGTGLSADEEQLLTMVAEGRAVKAIAAGLQSTPEAVDHAVEELFLHLARDASSGVRGALERLRRLHTAILEREEQGETLTRLLPSGLAEKLRADPAAVGRTERLIVTVLMSDVRGYSGIAERSDPSTLARQLNAHRQAMNRAILEQGGTVMQYVGDAVMAVFGAPFPQADHAERALCAAADMHRRQAAVDAEWSAEALEPFGMGIGLSTGEVAAALLGSDERLEYTLVGDIVNMAQRLQDLARPAGTTIVSEATAAAVPMGRFERLAPVRVKGRDAAVTACRVLPSDSESDDNSEVGEYSR